jgi:hypothetical protein
MSVAMASDHTESLDRPADLSAVLCCGHRGLAGGITDWELALHRLSDHDGRGH